MDIKEMEQFITQLKSVLSCKVVVDKENNIEEIHILSDTERNPKQLSRDIQSVLISKFGIDIDHKKISIAQIQNNSIDKKDIRLKMKSLEITTSGTKAYVKVLLEKDDEIYIGEVSGLNTEHNLQRLIATASIKSIENFLGMEDRFVVEDIKCINLAGREVVVTATTFVIDNNEELLSGCAFVNYEKNEAIVKSVLDAVNRRIVKYCIAS